MACDVTYSRYDVVPLAYFRMIREEQHRQRASLNREKYSEDPPRVALTEQRAADCMAEEVTSLKPNIAILRHAQGS